LASRHRADQSFNEESFNSGIGFDASSLRGWASINESTLLLIPDASRFWVDPFFEEPTLCMLRTPSTR